VREKGGLFGIRWGPFSLTDCGDVCVNPSGSDITYRQIEQMYCY